MKRNNNFISNSDGIGYNGIIQVVQKDQPGRTFIQYARTNDGYFRSIYYGTSRDNTIDASEKPFSQSIIYGGGGDDTYTLKYSENNIIADFADNDKIQTSETHPIIINNSDKTYIRACYLFIVTCIYPGNTIATVYGPRQSEVNYANFNNNPSTVFVK